MIIDHGRIVKKGSREKLLNRKVYIAYMIILVYKFK